MRRLSCSSRSGASSCSPWLHGLQSRRFAGITANGQHGGQGSRYPRSTRCPGAAEGRGTQPDSKLARGSRSGAGGALEASPAPPICSPRRRPPESRCQPQDQAARSRVNSRLQGSPPPPRGPTGRSRRGASLSSGVGARCGGGSGASRDPAPGGRGEPAGRRGTAPCPGDPRGGSTHPKGQAREIWGARL